MQEPLRAGRKLHVRITHIDGKLPNLALMRLSAWHKERGDTVHFTRNVRRDLFESDYDIVYGSAIFTRSLPLVERLRSEFPGAIVGGTALADSPDYDWLTVEQYIGESRYEKYDYSIYDNIGFDASLGFLSRGCRLACGFCRVPRKEGKPSSVATVHDIWRGEPYPKHIHLLDNDFFGNIIPADKMAELSQTTLPADLPRAMRMLEKQLIADGEAEWQKRLKEIREGGFKVCFNQGINVRMLDADTARALASVQYYDDSFTTRRLYTAWDNLKDEQIFLRGVRHLLDAGVKPHHLMVYMLVGFDQSETWERLFHRFNTMVDLGLKPYPMVFEREPGVSGNDLPYKQLRAFQRWVNRKYYQFVPWNEYRVSARSRLDDHRMALQLGLAA